MDERPRRPGRPRGFDRTAALATAQQLFRRHGYEGVSIAQLTQAMGIAPPSLYAAFGSKADLYRETIRSYVTDDGVDESLPVEGSAYDLVRAALRRGVLVVTQGDTPGCMISTGMLNAGPDNLALAREMRDHRRGFREKVEGWIRGDVAIGLLPTSVDAAGLARFYTSVMQGLSVQALDGATAADLAPVAEAALRAWPVRGGE